MMALLGSGLIEDDVGRGGSGRHLESDYKFKMTGSSQLYKDFFFTMHLHAFVVVDQFLTCML